MATSNNVWAGIGNSNTRSNNIAAASTVIVGGGPTPPAPPLFTSIGDLSLLPNIGFLTNPPLDASGPNGGYSYNSGNDTHTFDWDAVANTGQIDAWDAANCTSYAGTAFDLTNGTGLKYPDGTAVGKSDTFQVLVNWEYDGAGVTSQEWGIGFAVSDTNPALGTDFTASPGYIQSGGGITSDFGSIGVAGYAKQFGIFVVNGGSPGFSADIVMQNNKLVIPVYASTLYSAIGYFTAPVSTGLGVIYTTPGSAYEPFTTGGAPKLWMFLGGTVSGSPPSLATAGIVEISSIKYTVIKG
jgi:hypothetical protein